jgi:hypothetical protein
MMPTAEDFRVTLRAGCKGLNTHPKPLSRSILINFIARVGGYPSQNHSDADVLRRYEIRTGGCDPTGASGEARRFVQRSATSFPVADGDDHAPRHSDVKAWFVGLLAASTSDNAPLCRSAPPNTQPALPIQRDPSEHCLCTGMRKQARDDAMCRASKLAPRL